ncbi:1-deoxy-D-xylulose-5-phosphate synthase N-terminal domain-containing protein [Streptomyces cacaoi]|uniref:1-deoxy-D-xylulose-5-phosphate synthase N-terminal domain-containing protein n=1 Tax=Streptomyces cacaoi TaxID=1898 RepID=UPI00260C7259|nr:1-deoxy-D-xylulose-5-phosphate synthase N-terminal domain-containing protein [Streptomyces cacaoi]
MRLLRARRPAHVPEVLTGRQAGFHRPRKAGGRSGCPSREESGHGLAESAHASTALSYADGPAGADARPGGRFSGQVLAMRRVAPLPNGELRAGRGVCVLRSTNLVSGMTGRRKTGEAAASQEMADLSCLAAISSDALPSREAAFGERAARDFSGTFSAVTGTCKRLLAVRKGKPVTALKDVEHLVGAGALSTR